MTFVHLRKRQYAQRTNYIHRSERNLKLNGLFNIFLVERIMLIRLTTRSSGT